MFEKLRPDCCSLQPSQPVSSSGFCIWSDPQEHLALPVPGRCGGSSEQMPVAGRGPQ